MASLAIPYSTAATKSAGRPDGPSPASHSDAAAGSPLPRAERALDSINVERGSTISLVDIHDAGLEAANRALLQASVAGPEGGGELQRASVPTTCGLDFQFDDR
jgi:hypothetical protein